MLRAPNSSFSKDDASALPRLDSQGLGILVQQDGVSHCNIKLILGTSTQVFSPLSKNPGCGCDSIFKLFELRPKNNLEFPKDCY